MSDVKGWSAGLLQRFSEGVLVEELLPNAFSSDPEKSMIAVVLAEDYDLLMKDNERLRATLREIAQRDADGEIAFRALYGNSGY